MLPNPHIFLIRPIHIQTNKNNISHRLILAHDSSSDVRGYLNRDGNHHKDPQTLLVKYDVQTQHDHNA